MAYDSNNIFAKIIRGEIPCKKVYEDAEVLAFEDISPAAPLHVLVIPKGEYRSFDSFARKASPEEMVHFFRVVQKLAEELDVKESGYRLITNHGAEGGQTVDHFHIHLLGKKPMSKLLATE